MENISILFSIGVKNSYTVCQLWRFRQQKNILKTAALQNYDML